MIELPDNNSDIKYPPDCSKCGAMTFATGQCMRLCDRAIVKPTFSIADEIESLAKDVKNLLKRVKELQEYFKESKSKDV